MTDCTAALRELAAEVRALRAEVAALAPAPRRPLAAGDRAWLALLLPAARAAMGDRLWLAAELAAVALRADCGPLAGLLAATGGADLRKFGKRLARVAGHPAGGLVLVRVGSTGAGAVWQVTQSLETHRADFAPPRRAA